MTTIVTLVLAGLKGLGSWLGRLFSVWLEILRFFSFGFISFSFYDRLLH